MIGLLFALAFSIHPTQDGMIYRDAWTSHPFLPHSVGATCTQGEKDTCDAGCKVRYQTAYYKGARLLAAAKCDATTTCTAGEDGKQTCNRNVNCTCVWADEGAVKHTMF